MKLRRLFDRVAARTGSGPPPEPVRVPSEAPRASEAEQTLFIASAYRALLGRAPDEGGFDHYVRHLTTTANPAAVIVDLASSAEFRQRHNDGGVSTDPARWTSLVRSIYQGFLDRDADPDGLDNYRSQLAASVPLADIIASVVRSDEYRGRLALVEVQLAAMDHADRETRLRALSQVPPKVAWPVEDQRLQCLKVPAVLRAETAILVSHSPDGALKPHVEHLLRALLAQSMSVILIVQSDRSFCNIDQEFVNRLDGIVVRQNRGYDFAAWAHILRVHPALLELETLILLNDSLLGPTTTKDLGVFLDRMRHYATDLVGVTDSYERGWHIQSYFLLVKRPALRHEAFRAFFAAVVAFHDKQDVIDSYELRFAAVLMANGVSCGVLFKTDPETADNPMLYGWRTLLQGGFPFIKIMAVRDRIERVDSSDWRQQLLERGYDVSLADAILDPVHREWAAIAAPLPPRRSSGSLKYHGIILPDESHGPDSSLLEPVVQGDGTWSPDIAGPQAVLASFDVWNTLLHRYCHPDEIKLQSARFLYLTAHGDLRPAYHDLLTVFRARLQAEHRSAPHGDFEYQFPEAVLVWLDDVLVARMPADRRSVLAAAILAHEFAAESRSTRPDRLLGGYLATLTLPAIFVSDFYMPATFIRDVLARHGLAGWFVKGYSSCDRYINKRSGRLFAAVLDDFQLKPGQLLHIGDNATADVDVPASLGIQAIRYRNHNEERLQVWYADAFEAFSGGDGELHARRVAALLDETAGRVLAEPADTSDNALRALGIRHAPLVFSFCLHVLEEALKAGDETVFFFTREGVLLQKVFDVIVSEDPFNATPVASKLLSVSRMATFGASLENGGIRELMRLWTMYSNQSLAALSKSIGLSDLVMENASTCHGLDYHRVIPFPWTDRAFLTLWSDPDVKAHVALQIGTQRDRLKRYLEQAGFGVGRTAPRIVDIGWRGSIQDNLSHLLTRTIEGHYLALLPYLNPQPFGSRKHGWLSDANVPSRFLLEDQVAPLEMLLNAPGGSVTGYEERDGTMVPLLKLLDDEDRVALKLAPYREGMLSAVPALCRYIRLHGLTAETLLGLSRGIAAGLLSEPPAVLADLFGALSHNEFFGTGRVDRVGGETDLHEVLTEGHGAALHHGLTSWLKGARWPNGAVRQSAIREWYRHSRVEQRMAVPVAISMVCAPAVQKIRGDRLAVYVPAPLTASGGHRTIFNTVRRLSQIGLVPHICVDGGAGLDIVEDYLGSTRARIDTRWRDDMPCEFALATIAQSAHFVRHHVQAAHKCYLVQDAEALFNPIGDAYVVAENSYALGLHHFTIGNWLTQVINTRYGAPAIPAGLGVDTSVYRPLTDVRREKSICMLYQPDKPRRGNALGLQALRIVKRMDPDVRIVLYGSDSPVSLDFEVENIGLITDLHQLSRLYNACAAGLCISLSNPSRIPFEMAATGCMPVDVYRHNNLLDYAEGGAILAYQSANSLASALVSALDQRDDEPRRAALIASMEGRTLDWETDAIGSAVLEIASGTAIPASTLAPSYVSEPHLAASDRTPAVRRFCDTELRMVTP